MAENTNSGGPPIQIATGIRSNPAPEVAAAVEFFFVAVWMDGE